MNKKFLVLLILFSLTLAGCQKVEKEENNDNNDDNSTIAVQDLDKEIMSEDSEEIENIIIEEEVEEVKIIPTPIVVIPKPSIDPSLCEIDMDCVAIPHPANSCYKAYFNKNATEAINAYRNQEGVMVDDCPYFGSPVCIDNLCTAKK